MSSRSTRSSLALLSEASASLNALPATSPTSPSSSSSSIKKKRGQYKKINNEIREKIIKFAVNNGLQIKEIKSLLDVNEWTIRSVLRVHQKEHRSEKKSKGGSSKRFSSPQRNFLVQQQEKKNDLTYRQLQKSFMEKFNKKIDQSSVKRILIDENNYSTKRLVHIPFQRNLPENIEKRKQYSIRMGDAREELLIFVDETPFNLLIRRGRGRSKVGTRASIIVPCAKGNNVSCIAAMSPTRGLIHYELNLTSTDGNAFKKFISNMIKNNPVMSIKSHIIVMDNARIHQPGELTQLLEGERVKHQLQFLPPYSPQLNPIELMFSCWKAKIKDIEMNLETKQKDLIKWINETSVHVKDGVKAQGWYKRVTVHYIHCAAGRPLDEKYNANTLEMVP